jgi:hypothetical protein
MLLLLLLPLLRRGGNQQLQQLDQRSTMLLTCCAAAVFKVSKGATADALSTSAPSTASTFLYTYYCKATGATLAAALAVWPVLPVLLNHWFYALCLSLSLGAIWDFWCLVRPRPAQQPCPCCSKHFDDLTTADDGSNYDVRSAPWQT